MSTKTIFTHRFLARIIIEAETPIAVGSGDRNILTDRLVATDVNGLPFIPGSTLAGILRHSIPESNKEVVNKLFGYQDRDNGEGSRLIFSAAHMLGKDGKVIDGLKVIDYKDDFYNHFENLPIRQHVSISHKGSANQGGKFDEQVVYKGTRFCFELELVGNEEDNNSWIKLLNYFSDPAFRIGGGTRKGFGAIKVIKCLSEILNLEENLERYLSKSSSLEDENHWWNHSTSQIASQFHENDWTTYNVELTPENFYLFGSGFGNEDADMTYVIEKIVNWDEQSGLPLFEMEKVLIPATSVKGALAHRTAFHYNKKHEIFADNLMENGKLDSLVRLNYLPPHILERFNSNKFEDRAKLTLEYNPAVRSLFGYAANDNDGQRGNTIFSDIFLNNSPLKKKLLNHVAIDRFTGGAMDGALFSEEVVGNKEQLTLKILVSKGIKDDYLDAFESALHDLCTGKLALGGGTMRGHGCFNGSFTKV